MSHSCNFSNKTTVKNRKFVLKASHNDHSSLLPETLLTLQLYFESPSGVLQFVFAYVSLLHDAPTLHRFRVLSPIPECMTSETKSTN